MGNVEYTKFLFDEYGVVVFVRDCNGKGHGFDCRSNQYLYEYLMFDLVWVVLIKYYMYSHKLFGTHSTRKFFLIWD